MEIFEEEEDEMGAFLAWCRVSLQIGGPLWIDGWLALIWNITIPYVEFEEEEEGEKIDVGYSLIFSLFWRSPYRWSSSLIYSS